MRYLRYHGIFFSLKPPNLQVPLSKAPALPSKPTALPTSGASKNLLSSAASKALRMVPSLGWDGIVVPVDRDYYYGIIWDYMGLYGIIWDYMGSYGIIWDYMGLYGIIRDYMRLYGIGIIWDYMGLNNGIRWDSEHIVISHMGLFNGIYGIYGIYGYMVYNYIPCILISYHGISILWDNYII